MNEFAWLIEAPGQRYLAVQCLRMSNSFEWSQDHNKAIRFYSKEQADATMMAVRQLAPDFFGFEKTIGDARPVEHGWINSLHDVEPRTAAGSLD